MQNNHINYIEFSSSDLNQTKEVYQNDLTEIKEKITATGGQISKDIFSFPGGKRFPFLDPSGNELAIWSDQ